MFSPIFYPVDHGDGVFRPLTSELIVRGVLNRSGATLAVSDVVQFDLHRSQAETTSSDPTAGAITNGVFVSTSVWGNVCFPPTVAATLRSLSCSVFAYVVTGGVDNARVDVQVIGRAVGLTKAASANHAIGDTFIGVAGAATVAVTSGTLTGAKIIAIADTAGTSTTALTARFNGFGYGTN